MRFTMIVQKTFSAEWALKPVAGGLLLGLACLATESHAEQALPVLPYYKGGVITFSNTMPTGVLIYKCTGPRRSPATQCSQQTQLGTLKQQPYNSGYITNVPPQKVAKPPYLDPAPMAFLYETGAYVLWQQQKGSGGRGSPKWNSCLLTIDPQKGPGGNCTGMVWVNGPIPVTQPPEFRNCVASKSPKNGVPSCDPVVSINLYNNGGYIMTPGTRYSPSPAFAAPPAPVQSQPSFPARTFLVKYAGTNAAICLNIVGSFNQTPCSGDPNDIAVTSLTPYTFTYGKGQNLGNSPSNGTPYFPNSVFVVSGIKPAGQNAFIPVGQQPGMTDYGGRFEFAFYPQNMPSGSSPVPFKGGTLSTGVSTLDMSLVNGYNFSFSLYPNQPTICAFAQEERGPNHYAVWGPGAANDMASFVATKALCPLPQQVTSSSSFVGCQSDSTYASNTKSEWASAYGCTGSYNTAQTCPPPASNPSPYGYTPAPVPANAPNPWRPYSQNLGIGTQTVKNAYTWPYEDFRGTFTCDGNAQAYTLVIADLY